MANYIHRLKELNKTRLFKNVSWIFIGNVLHSLLGLLLGMYVARKLSLNDNGLVNYSASLVAFVRAVCGFGFSSLITREFASHEDEAGDYICSCIFAQAVAGAAAVIILQIVITFIGKDDPQLRWIVLAQSLSLIIGTPSILVYWFRYKSKPDAVAVLRIIAFFIAAIVRVVILETGAGIIPYVFSCLTETALFSTFLISFYRKTFTGSFHFSFRIVKRMIKVSYPFIFSAILSTIYAKTDTVMIKHMLDNSSVALYSVAVHLAGAISTIPSTLIEGFRPDIMESKLHDEKIYQKRFRQLYAIIFWSAIAYCCVITAFPRQIIMLLYGEKYLGAESALSLVVWYSSFSYMGSINNMYMVSDHKQKWVSFTTLIGALANVICNWLLIPKWGIMGAALASVITQFFANFVMFGLIKPLRPGFRMMIQGITLRDIGLVGFYKQLSHKK